MQLKKTFLLTALSTLTAIPSLAGIYSNVLSGLQNILDDKAAGIIENYQYKFAKEDLKHKKKGYEFNNFVTLSDSLGDQGSLGRLYNYIAGGQASPMYMEYLSLNYTGKHSVPRTKGGLNYSLRGASMIRFEANRASIQEQYEQLIKDNQGKLDRDSLYVVWGGNMDLNVLIARLDNLIGISASRYGITIPFIKKYDPDSPYFTLNKSPEMAAQITQGLINHGAPYVFVSNIMDGTLFPYSTMVFTEQIVENTLGLIKPLPYTWIIRLNGKLIDNYLRDPANIIPAQGREFFRVNQVNAMHHQLYWFLPRPVVEWLYDTMVFSQMKPTTQYNLSLERALSTVHGNVVFFDFAGLVNEIAYNYRSYGIETVLAPTCTIGYSSRSCDIGSPEYHQKISLFSDWFHPSPQLHLMIAQTMQAIFNAPVYASAIARHANSLDSARQSFIDNELDHWRFHPTQNLSKPKIFGTYSGSINHSGVYVDKKNSFSSLANIGIYYPINSNWIAGVAFSLSLGKHRPHHKFKYNFAYEALSLFTQYRHDHRWLSLDLGLAHLDAKTTRLTDLYKGAVLHKGKTSATSYNFAVKGGIMLHETNQESWGPILQAAFNRTKVAGYQENGKAFLAMHYRAYHMDKNYLSIGWQYQNKQCNWFGLPTQVSAEATYNHKIGQKSLRVPASLASAPILFNREIKGMPKGWFDTKVSAYFEWSKRTQLSANIGYSSDFKRQHDASFSLGLSHQY